MPENTQEKDMLENSTLRHHPEGRGLRPSFHALWHLKTLGVVPDLDAFEFDYRKAVACPKVVVMDTPIAHDHPNLRHVINHALSRDFSVFDDGAFVFPQMPNPSQAQADARDQQIKGILDALEDISAKAKDKYIETRKKAAEIQEKLSTFRGDKSLSAELRAAQNQMREIAVAGRLAQEQCATIHKESRATPGSPEDRSRFAKAVPGAHGTAVAGLIAAYPDAVRLREPAFVSDVTDLNEGEGSKEDEIFPVPYSGINHDCSIIPVSLTAAPNPRMVMGALHYVKAIQPDIVVIAAAWAEKIDFEQNQAAWDLVSEMLREISKDAVVLCAAGNQATGELVYPASLCADTTTNIWAVSACDPYGTDLSYAPDFDNDVNMIKTLSSQRPRADRERITREPFGARDEDLEDSFAMGGDGGHHGARAAPDDEQTERDKRFWAFDIITLDPPGKQGYNPTPFTKSDPMARRGDPDVFLEIGSLFTRFSGTSAATAIAAGLISRALAEGGGKTPDTDAVERGELFDLASARAMFPKA